MVFEGVAEDKELLDAVYPFVFVKDYLTRQAACRAIPAVIPVTSIRLHLSRLPSEIEELEGKNADARCGLIELCEVYIRFLMAGDRPGALWRSVPDAGETPAERTTLSGEAWGISLGIDSASSSAEHRVLCAWRSTGGSGGSG